MMEFKDTNLPYEQDIFQSFAAQAKTDSGEKAQNHAVLVAQILNTATEGNVDLVTQAFLGSIPEVAFGALARRFHPDTLATAKEIKLHARTGFAYLEDASPAVKAYAAADAIAKVMEFDAAVEESVKVTRALRAYGMKDSSGVEVPDAPLVKLLDSIAKNKTGVDALDWLLIQKTEAFRVSVDEKLNMVGRAPQPEREYEAFGETALLQDDKVKRAYETISSDPRVTPANAALALEVGRLLSAARPATNSTAIATALIDIALPGRTSSDLDFLQKRIDWDVMELLSAHPVRGAKSAKELGEAPLEFRQIAIAHAATVLHFALQEVQYAMTKDDKENRFVKFLKDSAMTTLNGRAKNAQQLEGVAETIESTGLQSLFRRELKAAQEYLAGNMPKPILALPAPKVEPKPERKGGFNL